MHRFCSFDTIYCNRSRWKIFTVFVDQSIITKLSSEIACAIGFAHTRLPSNCECFPVNYSLVLHTAKFFHLKRFAIYGNWLCDPISENWRLMLKLCFISELGYHSLCTYSFIGHGFKLAPVVGKILSELCLDLPPSYDLQPFKLTTHHS